MSTKVTIDKISVTIGKRTLDLTMEEARALKKALNDVLEPTITFTAPAERIIERHISVWPTWAEKMWAAPSEPAFEPPYRITCQSPAAFGKFA